MDENLAIITRVSCNLYFLEYTIIDYSGNLFEAYVNHSIYAYEDGSTLLRYYDNTIELWSATDLTLLQTHTLSLSEPPVSAIACLGIIMVLATTQIVALSSDNFEVLGSVPVALSMEYYDFKCF